MTTLNLRPALEHVDDPQIERNFNALSAFMAALGIYAGTGSPEGVVTAGIGAIYRRLDGGAGTSVYVKESNPTPSTGWIGK
jgi:L-aminopeptidase/D-esterase-like protein